MKQIKNMSQVESAALIQDSLQEEGIQVVFPGGSAVSFYSSNRLKLDSHSKIIQSMPCPFCPLFKVA